MSALLRGTPAGLGCWSLCARTLEVLATTAGSAT